MSVIFASSNAALFGGLIETYSGAAEARDGTVNDEELRILHVSNTSVTVGVLTLPIAPSTQTTWLHFRAKFPTESDSGAADGAFLRFRELPYGGTQSLGGIDVNNGNLRTYAATGSDYGAEFSLVPGTVYEFDIQITAPALIGEDYIINMYVDGVLESTSSATTGVGGIEPLGVIEFDVFDFMGVSGSGDARYGYYSDFIIDDTTSTIGKFLVAPALASNGSNTDFSGGYLNLAELDSGTITGDATDVFTWNPEDYTGPNTGETCTAVVIQSTGITGASGPTGYTPTVRSGGTNYFGTADSVGAASQFKAQEVFSVDPNTAAAWTIANLDAAEFGIRADA